MSEKFADTRCEMCKIQLTIMKRCTRCKSVLYCSRECQVKHWQAHKSACQSNTDTSSATKSVSLSSASSYQTDDHSIFEDNSVRAQNKLEVSHPPLVDFSKAVNKSKDLLVTQPEGKFYLSHGKFCTDVPECDEQLPKSLITVKCHKEKHKLYIQKSWTGEDVYKFLSYSLKVPLEKVKLIHKGKVLNRDSVCEKIADKAVFQVIGELAESEEGVDQRDISCMMKQMGIDRNAAIKALRNKGDLIDALLDQ